MLGLSPDSVHMDRSDFAYIAALLAFVWGMPNVQQWMGHFRTALNYQAQLHWTERLLPVSAWRPSAIHGMAVGVLGFFALAIAFPWRRPNFSTSSSDHDKESRHATTLLATAAP